MTQLLQRLQTPSKGSTGSEVFNVLTESTDSGSPHPTTDKRVARMLRSAALLVMLAGAAAAGTAKADQPQVRRGHDFAQTNCAPCHAISQIGESPLAKAPPFRSLHLRYQVEDLSEALA